MKTMNILVADHDPIIRKLFEKRLHREGYLVSVAVDGAEAARMLDNEHFDVMITELVMPGDIGGIELLNIAKEKDPGIEVIVITAHSSVDTAVDAMKKGAVDSLEKPVNFDKLFLRLEKIWEVKSLLKNAGDLREPMDVTETRTIQDLEMLNNGLQGKLERIETILNDLRLDEYNRIEQALQVIKRPISRMESSMNVEAATFERLRQIVAVLRGDGGCPWDRRQTPGTLKKYLLEECRELAEAIDSGQAEAIAEETGDVLFILALLIAMFEEQDRFTAESVLKQIIAKMIRRHPHVFAGVPLGDEQELRLQWERIKAEEKSGNRS